MFTVQVWSVTNQQWNTVNVDSMSDCVRLTDSLNTYFVVSRKIGVNYAPIAGDSINEVFLNGFSKDWNKKFKHSIRALKSNGWK